MAAAHVQKLLFRVPRERQIPRERRRALHLLSEKPSLEREALYTPVLAIGYVHYAVIGRADRVRNPELVRAGPVEARPLPAPARERAPGSCSAAPSPGTCAARSSLRCALRCVIYG